MFGGWRGIDGYGPVGMRTSGESIVTINLGEMKRGTDWRESHMAVL